MRSIYQNAQNVIVWLGRGDTRTDLLFTQMIELDRGVTRRHRSRDLTTWEEAWKPLQQSLDFQSYLADVLEDLLSHDWFDRVWTVQEAAMARSMIIACGRKEVASRAFIVMPKLLDITPTANQQARLDIMPGLRRGASWYSQFQNTHFRTLLKQFASSKATNLYDKIYALIGLCKKAYSSTLLVPDYGLTEQEVADRTLAFLLKELADDSGYPIQYDEEHPDWSFDVLLGAVQDLAYHLYSWALRKLQGNRGYLMFLALAGEKAKGNSHGFKRLAMLRGSMDIAVMENHQALFHMLLEVPDTVLHREASLEDQVWYLALKLGHYDHALKILTIWDRNCRLASCNAGNIPAEVAQGEEPVQALAHLLPHYCNVAEVAQHLQLDRSFIQPGTERQALIREKLLCAAAEQGNKQSIKLFLKHGVDTNVTTALLAAIGAGHWECVNLLLHHGAPADGKKYTTKDTPLSIAARQGDYQCIGVLLAHGADPRGEDGLRARKAALDAGYSQCSRFLPPKQGKPLDEMTTLLAAVSDGAVYARCAELLRTWAKLPGLPLHWRRMKISSTKAIDAEKAFRESKLFANPSNAPVEFRHEIQLLLAKIEGSSGAPGEELMKYRPRAG